ncbi:hypothetical protein NQ318_017898 [Aromia moschata]|uniref:Fibronectin type-III domain-containing protein n=1 Tax=Aromia moschata TaxID=1265417 RepID=A0AAV8YCJ9_9CUCU|nr:hypothetical protein NQ318_017898 [Aromia moschata]
MTSSFFSLVVVTFIVGGIGLTTQEPCEPGYVTDLEVNDNFTVSWKTPDDENCQIDHYFVYMSFLNGSIQHTYSVITEYIHFTHLRSCEAYSIRVHQVSSDNIIGLGLGILLVAPPPEEANLGLNFVNVTQVGANVRLDWSLDDEWRTCANRYRVVVVNEDSNDAMDIYTQATSLILNHLVPCGHYTLTVVALFTVFQEGPITAVRHTAIDRITTAPAVAGITVEQTSVTIEWVLEEYSSNRCPINSIVIDGSPSFNLTYPVEDQVNRTPLPLTISNLNTNSMYYLRVRADNSAGPSSPTLLAVQTRTAS